MARFMDVHSGFVGVTAEQLKAAPRRPRDRGGGGHALRAGVARPGGGQGVLPLDRAVQGERMRIHERAGHPTAEVYEVPVEV